MTHALAHGFMPRPEKALMVVLSLLPLGLGNVGGSRQHRAGAFRLNQN